MSASRVRRWRSSVSSRGGHRVEADGELADDRQPRPRERRADADGVVAGLDLAGGLDQLVERPRGEEQRPAHPDQDGDDEGQGDEPGQRPELREDERDRRDERAGDEQEEQPEQAAEPAGRAPRRPYAPPRPASGIRRRRHCSRAARQSLLVPAGEPGRTAAVPLATARLVVGRHPSPARSSANR